jgi:hypothetical protein
MVLITEAEVLSTRRAERAALGRAPLLGRVDEIIKRRFQLGCRRSRFTRSLRSRHLLLTLTLLDKRGPLSTLSAAHRFVSSEGRAVLTTIHIAGCTKLFLALILIPVPKNVCMFTL